MTSDFLQRKSGRTRNLLVIALYIVSLICEASASALIDQALFGPKRFEHLKGKPTVETGGFKGCKGGGNAVLHITNGDIDRPRITSAEIHVNNVEVVKENDFKKRATVFEKKYSSERQCFLK